MNATSTQPQSFSKLKTFTFCYMESVTLTANLITSLAFQRFSEKLSESQIASRNQLRQKIWDKFRNNPKAENALIAAERDSQSDLEQISAYLQVAMYEDPQFAYEIQAIVQELIDTQGEIPLNAKDIQARGNQIIVSASGGALIGSLLAGVPGAVAGVAFGSAVGWLSKTRASRRARAEQS